MYQSDLHKDFALLQNLPLDDIQGKTTWKVGTVYHTITRTYLKSIIYWNAQKYNIDRNQNLVIKEKV